jgi:transposase
MESTGLYWLGLAQLLSEAGIEVILVNARRVRHLPGRKSDVLDCQWLQYLHSMGLLRGSFRPADHLCARRSLTRYRAAWSRKPPIRCGTPKRRSRK